jgi:hypothetical protein
MTSADIARRAAPDARLHRASCGLAEDKGEQRTRVGVGVAEAMRSAAGRMGREKDRTRISRHDE